MTPEEKLKVYLQAQSAYDSKAIPGKNAFTFISKRTGMPQAWTLNEKQEPVLFGAFQDRVMSVHHAPGGDKTVIGMDHGGNEKQQLYLMYREKAPVPLVVSHDHFHHFGGFSPYGEEIAFTSNRRHPGYFDVFIQNLETKQTRKVYIYNGKCEVLKWLPDGKHLLISLQTTNLNNSIYKLDIETGKVLTDAGENDDASYTSIVPTHDGKEAYLLTDHQAETTYISQMSLTALNERKTLYHEEKWDVEAIELSPDEKTLIFSVNEGGVSRLMVMETSTHDVRKMDGVPGGVISSMSWLDDTRCIFTLKTPVEPGDIWQVTLPEGQVKRLTHFGESVKSVPLYEPKICHYESFDGLRVPYFYYDHNESSDKPAVVYVHGGPEGQTRADYNPII